MLPGFLSWGPVSCRKTAPISGEYTFVRQIVRWRRSRPDSLPGAQGLASEGKRKQRHRAVWNSVSKQSDTDLPPMKKQPESTNHSSPAEAVSKAEEALDQLVFGHAGTTKVRHRDKALRALDYAGVSRICLFTQTSTSRQCHWWTFRDSEQPVLLVQEAHMCYLDLLFSS